MGEPGCDGTAKGYCKLLPLPGCRGARRDPQKSLISVQLARHHAVGLDGPHPRLLRGGDCLLLPLCQASVQLNPSARVSGNCFQDSAVRVAFQECDQRVQVHHCAGHLLVCRDHAPVLLSQLGALKAALGCRRVREVHAVQLGLEARWPRGELGHHRELHGHALHPGLRGYHFSAAEMAARAGRRVRWGQCGVFGITGHSRHQRRGLHLDQGGTSLGAFGEPAYAR
mmetsp:Transcript_5422/g.12790  ORF Transcript_5422/g.12790 Transcript_5422/m.12790 type:complete len:226 (+) Transcript_5422:732-1409(+)